MSARSRGPVAAMPAGSTPSSATARSASSRTRSTPRAGSRSTRSVTARASAPTRIEPTGAPARGRLSTVRPGGFVDEFERLLDQDLARHLSQRGARDVLVPGEALEIDLRQDVAEGVVRQPGE